MIKWYGGGEMGKTRGFVGADNQVKVDAKVSVSCRRGWVGVHAGTKISFGHGQGTELPRPAQIHVETMHPAAARRDAVAGQRCGRGNVRRVLSGKIDGTNPTLAFGRFYSGFLAGPMLVQASLVWFYVCMYIHNMIRGVNPGKGRKNKV